MSGHFDRAQRSGNSQGAPPQTAQTPGKRTLTEGLPPAPATAPQPSADAAGTTGALDPALQANVGALTLYVPRLATLGITLRTDHEQASHAALEANNLITMVASLVMILRGAEAKLRSANEWLAVAPLLAGADDLVRDVAPLARTALHSGHSPAADAPQRASPLPWTSASDDGHAGAQEDARAPTRDPAAQFADALPRPHIPDRQAFYGLELFAVADQSLIKYARVNTDGRAGPREAGPYAIHAYLQAPSDSLLCFCAFHKQRQQNEWMMGVDRISEFVANVDLYAGAAQKAYPGSANVPETMADGANGNPHIASNLEQESFGAAPWQAGGKQQPIGAPSAAAALASTKGGSSLVGMRNSAIRLDEYAKPARMIAEDLQRKVASGELDHLAARGQAVEGRNQLMRQARERMSPGAAAASRYAKEDKGASVEQLVERKIRALLSESGVPEDQLAAVRAAQAADSELWSRYKIALTEGESAELVYNNAVRDLGASPIVSKEIIKSAGKTNPKVSAAATLGEYAGAALGALGVGSMVYDILTAEEGERLIVAAKDLSGFTGGIVGAELGTAGAAWFASLIPGVGEAVLVVTLIGMAGGAAGGILGGTAGEMMPEMAGIATSEEMKALMPSSMMSTEGGLGGMHEREQAQHSPQAMLLVSRVRDAIFQLDAQVTELEKEIHDAPDRQQMTIRQKMRIEVLRTRGKLEDIYAQLEKQNKP